MSEASIEHEKCKRCGKEVPVYDLNEADVCGKCEYYGKTGEEEIDDRNN